jgi:uncharacterized phage infection (PIP) family protein YhgE
MGDELDFDPPSLRGAGGELANAADQLNQQWQALLANVKGMGEIFGDDMVGSLIGISYQTAQQMADESFSSAIEELGYYGEGLNVMADNYEQTEQGIGSGMDSIRGEL